MTYTVTACGRCERGIQRWRDKALCLLDAAQVAPAPATLLWKGQKTSKLYALTLSSYD